MDWLQCNLIVWNYSWSRRNDCGRSCGVKRCPSLLHSGGGPAKVIKFYWTIEEIIEHEKQLYSDSERYTREELEEFLKAVNR